MTDKCTSERHVISNQLPQASKLICLFHALQIFQREITASKLNITNVEVTKSLQYINKLANAESEENYNNLLTEMKKDVPKPVLNYFFKNWHDLRNEWVRGLTAKSGNFFNSTNNRLESLNAKLKSIISTYSTLNEFIEKIFMFLNIKRMQFKNQLSKMMLKVPCNISKSKTEISFYKYVTPFAFAKLENILKLVCSPTSPLNYNFVVENGIVLCYTRQNKRYEVSDLTCDCNFFLSMKLPCKHLLAYRKYCGFEIFHEDLFAKRWTRDYILNGLEENNNQELSEIIHMPEILTVSKKQISEQNTRKPLTSHQKFKKAEAVCLTLATLCSEISTEDFYRRFNFLVELQHKWKNHEDILNINDEHNYYTKSTVENINKISGIMLDQEKHLSNIDLNDTTNTDLNGVINIDLNSITTEQDLEGNEQINSLELETIYDDNHNTIVMAADYADLKNISLPVSFIILLT